MHWGLKFDGQQSSSGRWPALGGPICVSLRGAEVGTVWFAPPEMAGGCQTPVLLGQLPITVSQAALNLRGLKQRLQFQRMITGQFFFSFLF